MFVIAFVSLNIVLSDGGFVHQLNSFYKFDHNIYMFTDPQHMLQKEIYDDGTPQTVLLLNSDNVNQQPYRRIALSSGNNCMLLVFINASLIIKDFILSDIERNSTKELLFWNMKIKIGFIIISTGNVSVYEERVILADIFSWSRINLIVNVFVLLQGGNYEQVFTYSPYKSNEIMHVKSNQLWMYFHDKGSDLYGHQLHVSFLYEDASIRYTKNGFESRDGKMCEYILKGLNATYYVTFRETITLGLYEKQIMDGTVDFTPRRDELLDISDPTSRIFTYPVTMDSVTLLVPKAKPYNQFHAFLKNFTVDNSIIMILIPIMLIIITFWVFRLFKYAESMLLRSCVDVISLLFTLDVEGGVNCSGKNDRLFMLSLSFGGFFFTNVIMSVFISLLMQPVMQPEINTFNEFDKTSLKIAVPDPAYTIPVLQLSALKGSDWKNRIEEAYKLDKFMYQMYSYNTKFAYCITKSRSDVLIERQKHLGLRGFHLPRDYLRQTLTAYYIGSRAPFKDRVDLLIQRAFSAGLYDKWNRDTYPNLINVGYFNKFNIIKEEPEDSFTVPVVIVYGCFLSLAVFLCEFCYFYLEKRRVKK